MNLSVPSELLEEVRRQIPDLNLSAVLQEALREHLECTHERLGCARCGVPVSRDGIIDRALTYFYGDVQAALGPLVRQGGTAEGAARKVREVAVEWQLRFAIETPAPSLTKAERVASRVKELPDLRAVRSPRESAAAARSGRAADAG